MPKPYDVSIKVRADRPTEPYRALWNWFGYDEPNYTYSAHGKKLLAELTELCPEAPRIRTHNLLSSGDGTVALKWGSTNAYTEDARGNPVYDWRTFCFGTLTSGEVRDVPAQRGAHARFGVGHVWPNRRGSLWLRRTAK